MAREIKEAMGGREHLDHTSRADRTFLGTPVAWYGFDARQRKRVVPMLMVEL